MKKELFIKGLLALKGENAWLKYSLTFSLVIVLILSIALALRTQVVTIIPPTLNETSWVDKNAASSPYMRSWALYIANSLGNATPSSVDLLKQSIGPFLSTSIYTAVMKGIDDQIDQIKQDRISLYFTPSQVITDPAEPGTYFVEGDQSVEGINGDPVTKQMTFTIKIEVSGYRPQVTYVGVATGRAKLPSEQKENR